MRMLIRRELDEMMVSASRKESVVSTIITALVISLLIWLLGPRIFDVLDAKAITAFLFIAALVNDGGGMNLSLEADGSNRQTSFLQTLPLRKSQIIHAKYLSVLILCGKSFVWMTVLVSLNLIINSNWTFISWMPVLFAVSIVIFLMAENLLRYFLWGFRKRSNGIYIFSLMVWMMLFQSGFYFNPFGFSQSLLWILCLFFSLLAYFICWQVSLRRIRKRGFPKEVESPDLVRAEKFAEELKRRQSERKS